MSEQVDRFSGDTKPFLYDKNSLDHSHECAHSCRAPGGNTAALNKVKVRRAEPGRGLVPRARAAWARASERNDKRDAGSWAQISRNTF